MSVLEIVFVEECEVFVCVDFIQFFLLWDSMRCLFVLILYISFFFSLCRRV